MSQVPEVSASTTHLRWHTKGKPAKCATTHKNLQTALKDSDSGRNLSSVKSKQGSNEEGSYPTEQWPSPEDKRDNEDLIPKLGLWGGIQGHVKICIAIQKEFKEVRQQGYWDMTHY